MADVDAFLRIMDDIEDSYVPVLSDIIGASMDHLISDYVATGSSAGLPLSYRQSLNETMNALWLNSMRGLAALNDEDFGLKADIPLGLIEDYIANYGGLSVFRVIRTTEEQVLRTILAGQANGLTLSEITKELVNQLPSLATHRATAIIRTETHGASQYGSQRIAEASGYNLRKRWNTVGDARVRTFNNVLGRSSAFSHRAMQGMVIPLREHFRVPTRGGGYELLMFPGDPMGSAGNIIQCRCVQTYIRRA